MLGRNLISTGKNLLANRGLQNQVVRASHGHGGIPGEVYNFI